MLKELKQPEIEEYMERTDGAIVDSATEMLEIRKLIFEGNKGKAEDIEVMNEKSRKEIGTMK